MLFYSFIWHLHETHTYLLLSTKKLFKTRRLNENVKSKATQKICDFVDIFNHEVAALCHHTSHVVDLVFYHFNVITVFSYWIEILNTAQDVYTVLINCPLKYIFFKLNHTREFILAEKIYMKSLNSS